MRITLIAQRFINQILIIIALTVRPFLGAAQCRFYETCTPYIVRQLKEKAPHRALWCIVKRLAACSPFYSVIPKNDLPYT
jgi:putative component of membrane protein insertase Oxa1/YidC/SpoIIIJ protein YidD